MIDIRVHTFITLSKLKSYTKTAEALCITQPAVTQHIKHLENHYEQKFIMQQGGKLQLTSAGERFLQYCLHIYNYSKQIEKVLLEMKDHGRSIHFGATLSIGGFLMPPILAQYMREYPHMQMKMIIENTEILLKKLRIGEIEFALVEGYFNQADFTIKSLKKEPFILVASPQNEIALQKEVTFESLRNQVLMVREEGSGTREILERAMTERNDHIKNFKRLIEIGSLEVIKEMVKSNLGISFMYEVAAAKELQEGTLVAVSIKEMKLEKEFHLAYMEKAILEEEYLEFFAFIQNRVSYLTGLSYNGNKVIT
ncbi:MAG: LysR family transcriptional regulator [Cellulosilyticaceae bacterium]